MTLALNSLSPDATNASESVTTPSSTFGAGRGQAIKAHVRACAKSVTPFMALLVASSMAHAAPSIDMSGVTSVMQTVETACLLIGSIIVLISLVFSVFSFAGGNVMRGITGVAGVLFGGLVIGLGPTWISSLTGQSV